MGSLAGNVAIPQGATSVQVSGLGLLSVSGMPMLTVIAPNPAPDFIFAFIVGVPTTDGFSIGLSAGPSVAGYSVQWDWTGPAGTPGPGPVFPTTCSGGMRTCTFQSVLQGTGRMLGLDVTRDLSPSRAAMLTEYINNRVKEGWEYDWWPEFTTREQRAYRQNWNNTANWQAGTHVLFYTPTYPCYFQALQANINQPPTDSQGNVNYAYWALAANGWSAARWSPDFSYTLGFQILDPNTGNYFQCINPHVSGATINYAYWGLLVPFDRYIGYTQPFPAIRGCKTPWGGATPLGRVKSVSVNDPFIATRNPAYIPFRISNRGVQVNIEAPPIVWVQFAYREPVFTTTPWSSTGAYTGSGELVYLSSTGNCYASIVEATGQNPATATAYWAVVGFPLVLSNFVKRAALADALRDLKQQDRAQMEEDRAYQELSNAQDREIQAQSGAEMASVQTYGGGWESFFAS